MVENNVQQCLVLIKPDGLIKSLTGNIITALSETKLVIVGAKIVQVDRELAEKHYNELRESKGEEIFEETLKYIQGKYHTNRVLAMVYEGENAIEKIKTSYSEIDIEKNNLIVYQPSKKELKKNKIDSESDVDIYGTNVKRDVIAEYNIEKDETTYHIFYGSPIEDYFEKRNEEIRDTANLVPFKKLIVDKFPGLYGWTILTDNVMGLDAGLQKGDPEFKKMVYVHEAIHTPDEFETRMITDWIMSKEMPMSYQLMGKNKFL